MKQKSFRPRDREWCNLVTILAMLMKKDLQHCKMNVLCQPRHDSVTGDTVGKSVTLSG